MLMQTTNSLVLSTHHKESSGDRGRSGNNRTQSCRHAAAHGGLGFAFSCHPRENDRKAMLGVTSQVH